MPANSSYNSIKSTTKKNYVVKKKKEKKNAKAYKSKK